MRWIIDEFPSESGNTYFLKIVGTVDTISYVGFKTGIRVVDYRRDSFGIFFVIHFHASEYSVEWLISS